MVCTVLRFRAELPIIVVRLCTWWAYICQSVLLTLIYQLALTFMWSHGHCARWSSGCPMQVASAVSACPSMPLQQNQPAASCLFPNFASHRRPTSVSCSKNRYCFGSRWVQCPTPWSPCTVVYRSISSLHSKQFFSTYIYYALIPETSLFTSTHRGAIYQPSWSAVYVRVYAHPSLEPLILHTKIVLTPFCSVQVALDSYRHDLYVSVHVSFYI